MMQNVAAALKTRIQQTQDRYAHADPVHVKYLAHAGLTRELIEEISWQKQEPDWMRTKRLQAFEHLQTVSLPSWGPDLSGLNLSNIVYYVRPDAEESTSWEDVPIDIRNTFERLGIPEAEQRALSGVGAQYDSDVVYHNLKEEWKAQGVVFENMDVAVQKYPELVQSMFMTQCVPTIDHPLATLHAAVWSGGTFIYVPPGVQVTVPLQAYFRMNMERGGQFEHTLIVADEGSSVTYIEGCSAPRYASSALHAGCVELFVKKGAKMRYVSIENWSKNTFNLNTKRALVDEDATIEWVNGNVGSGRTMLYPCSVLRGRGARSDSLGVAFAGAGQEQDTGTKVIHAAPYTTSTTHGKSVSTQGGVSTYRGLVRVTRSAHHAKAHVRCDAMLIGTSAISRTYPSIRVDAADAQVTHEASVGRLGQEQLFYAMSRGLSEAAAMKLIVSGFIEPIVHTLPLEYAVEFQQLFDLELEHVSERV